MRNLINVQIRLDPDTVDKLRRELIFENDVSDHHLSRQDFLESIIKQTIRAREQSRQQKKEG